MSTSDEMIESQVYTTLQQGTKTTTDRDLTTDPSQSWRSLIQKSIKKTRHIRGSNYVQLATVEEQNQPRCRTVVFRGFLDLPSSSIYDHLYGNYCVDHDDDGTTTTANSSTTTTTTTTRSCILQMCTDARSAKVVHASTDSLTEVVWWFPTTNEQYRIRGKLVFVGGDDSSKGIIDNNNNNNNDSVLQDARLALWKKLSPAARNSFFVPKIPGADYVPDEETAVVENKTNDNITNDPESIPTPPKSFLLMLVFPNRVDYLNLKQNYRQIDVFHDTTTQEEESDEALSFWKSKRVNP